MDEMYHHQHTSHHKIERTSIRTYYSNLDLSQSSTSNQTSSQSRRHQPTQDMQLILRQPDFRQGNQAYMNQLERYIEDLDGDADADFEDEDESMYRRTRRGSYAPGMTSRQIQSSARYAELMPTSLQTAKGRMQNSRQGQHQQQQLHQQLLLQQQQQQQQQRLRSPSLPVIRHRARQGEKVAGPGAGGGVAAGPGVGAGVGAGTTKPKDFDPSNGTHRLNNNPPGAQGNQGVAPGCQEEDTSGYLSDTPKNPHTPDIWFNDGASQIESVSGVGSASVLEEMAGGGAIGGMGMAGCRRLRRSIQGGAGAAQLPAPMAIPLPIPMPMAAHHPPPPVKPPNLAYVIKGRRVPGQGYEPLAADGYMADGWVAVTRWPNHTQIQKANIN